MARWTDEVTGSAAIERRILQRRLSAFGRIVAGFMLGYLLAFNYVNLLNASFDWMRNTSNQLHLAGAVVMTGVWLASRTGDPSIAFLKALDAAGFLLTGFAITLPVWTADPTGTRNWAMQLELANLMAARSALVPSSGTRTMALCASLSPFATYATYLFEVRRIQPPEDVVRHTAEAFLFCSLAAGVATVASQVIFGLRARVREAHRIGQYILIEKVGEGAMGVVYRANHAMLKRSTAVKLLPPEKSDEEARQRFEHEVQFTSKLTHPNTVAIYDYGSTRTGVFYFAMEYLDGLNLDQLVRNFGPPPVARTVHIIRQICASLAEAHEMGLVHRDVKPANVVLCERWGTSDVVKVVDFGLVRSYNGSDAALKESFAIGTPQHMSPEAISSPNEVGPRSDLYAVGTVAYYMLTGVHVFEAPGVPEVLRHHLSTTPEPPSRRVSSPIPAALDALVMSCLEKSPADRPASAGALQDALGACEGVDVWTQSEARAWWAHFRHSQVLGALGPDTRGGDHTRSIALDVDMRARAAATRPLGT